MIHNKIEMKVEGSLEGASLYTYILDNSPEIGIEKRPILVLCPGGGYEMTSDREAEAVAVQFMAMGYHVAVLRYSVKPATYPTALLELGKSVVYLREKAEEWNIDTDKLIIQGASAGGHLAASYAMLWQENFVSEALGVSKERLKPNGLMLSYPVITSGEYAHRDSFKNLLGDQYDSLVDWVSLEKRVSKDTPKTFVWHTYTDDCVPPENSLLLVDALKKHNIPTEFHLFPEGGHGLGLANELTACPNGYGVEEACAIWIKLAGTWLKNI